MILIYIFVCDLHFSCHSSIGRDGGEQTITIGQDCYYLGVIMHEMTHAVGFFHEQNRWDRDQYITIHWNNILAGETNRNYHRSLMQTEKFQPEGKR